MNVPSLQPLEFKDFSGGLTDHVLQGDSRRYAKADNFLITVDHKLECRDGTTVYDPTAYALPGNSNRIQGLFTGINESFLFAHANRDLFTQSPDSSYGTAFAAIRGPSGNEALSGGVNYSQVSVAEFQHQLYYTSDFGTQPGKIFRDQTNTWKAVTAGLPKMAFVPNYTVSSLLSKCLQLANNLRSSMMSHFQDQAGVSGSTSSNFQHSLTDKWALSYFQAVSWSASDAYYPGPAVQPTPAAAATDSASLFTLCLALGLSYEQHRNDLSGTVPATGAGGSRQVHLSTQIYPAASGLGSIPIHLGIAAKLTASGIVTTVSKAAIFLDELTQKWYWHQLTPFAHSATNDLPTMSRYLLSTKNQSIKIGVVYLDPLVVQVTPNYNDFIAYALWIKTGFNTHINNTNEYQGQIDPYGPITLPDPNDFDSSALTIFWARWLYGENHVYDSNAATHTGLTFDTVAGSNAISNVVVTSGGADLTLSVDQWVITLTDVFNDPVPQNRRAARALAGSTPRNATLSRTAIATDTYLGQHSTSWVHGSYTGGAFVDTTTLTAGAGEFLATDPGTIGTDLSTWISLGKEFLIALGQHQKNAQTHRAADFLGNTLTGNSAINGNPFFVPVVATYSWASFYRYTYTVEQNGLIYLNQGAPIYSNSFQTLASYPVNTILTSPSKTYVQLNDPVMVVENASATLSGIPDLSNDTTTNYDTTVSVVPIPTDPSVTGYNQNLTIELYRTSDGGTVFYALESVTNSTTSYSDVTNELYPRPGDTALNLRKVIYTAGGVVANDQPPVCKYTHNLNGFVYCGAITDTGQYFPQRIRQSIQGAPDSAPATFFDDMDDDLTGISSSRSNLIALCKNSIYRVQGSFTSVGQGLMSHEKISPTIGCLSTKSIVQTELGVFFAGTDGFYYTDGYQLIKISLDLDKTYLSMTKSDAQKSRIYGAFDKLKRRIWWAMQTQETASDNDVFFVYYLDYGVKPSGVFTKAFTNNSWQPASAVFYKGRLVIGDSRGYLFKTEPTRKTDPYVDTSVTPSNWKTAYLPWAFRSCALDLGTAAKRKWVTKIHAVGENIGNGAIQINTINDMGTAPDGSSSALPLAPLQYVANPMWGDPTLIWGSSACAWKYDGKMDAWRRFPSRSLRSDFKQIEYVPGNFVVYKYDSYPQFAFAAVDASAKTATLATPSGYTSVLWPLDVLDYYLSFDTDAYATKYLITAIDSTKKIITFSDSANAVTTAAAAKWQISGIKKEQRIRITAFDIHVGAMGEQFSAYPGASASGGEGGNA